MKKSILLIITSILVFLTFSCQKKPINGDLDGEWEVMDVYPDPPDKDDDLRIFYNFSRHVCQLTYYGGPFTLGTLSYIDDTITLYFPYIESESEANKLKQYGIFTNPVSFNVYFETKNKLILSNEDVVVMLRKF